MISTVATVLRSGTNALSVLSSQNLPQDAHREARILMAHTLGIDPGRLTLELSTQISETQIAQFEGFIERRKAHEPISYIIARRMFWGHEFKVTADVLDPRPETETIVAYCVQNLNPKRILDLGTGSGCLAISILLEFPDATAVASDISPAALLVARENANLLGVGERIEFVQSDWFARIKGHYDLVLSNPPYIASSELASLQKDVTQWEPALALSPGPAGTEPYAIIAAYLAAYLPKGDALLEFGKTQSQEISAIFFENGFENCEILQDMNGHNRVIRIQNG